MSLATKSVTRSTDVIEVKEEQPRPTLFLCSAKISSHDISRLKNIGRTIVMADTPEEAKQFDQYDFIILDTHKAEELALLRFIDLAACKIVAYVRSFEKSDESWLKPFQGQDLLMIKRLPDLSSLHDKSELLRSLFASQIKTPKSLIGFYIRKALSFLFSLLSGK